MGACSPFTTDLTDRPCDAAGACVSGYVCHPETNRCTPHITIACDGSGVCPEELTTGDTCSAPGSFVSCVPHLPGCDGGCRTCQGDGTWSACSKEVCTLGKVGSCGSCGQDCAAQVIGADPLCVPKGSGYDCDYSGSCWPGWVDADQAGHNGCECRVEAEICDGVDNDCDGLVDEAEDELCDAGFICESSTCVPCTPDDPLRCGPSCAVCDGAQPLCVAGACICHDTSCGAQAICLADGRCAPLGKGGLVSVSPRRVWANGTDVATVTVMVTSAGGSPISGAAVTLLSSIPEDVIIPAVGTSDASGTVTFKVASQVAGVHQLTAVDLDAPAGVGGPVEVAFLPVADLDSHYSLDRPSGVAVTSSNGDDGSRTPVGHYHLDTYVDEVLPGTSDFGMLEDDTFADGLVESRWNGRAFNASTGFTALDEPYVSEGEGSEIRVEAAAGGGVRLYVSSSGAAAQNPDTPNHLAGLWRVLSAGQMHGAYSIQVDYNIAEATASSNHMPVRLSVVYPTPGTPNVYTQVSVEVYREGGALKARGFMLYDGVVVSGTSTPLQAPPTVGTLRLTREGPVHRAYVVAGATTTLLYEQSAGPTIDPMFLYISTYMLSTKVGVSDVTVRNLRFMDAPIHHNDAPFGGGLSFLGGNVLETSLGIELMPAVSLEAWFRAGHTVAAGQHRRALIDARSHTDGTEHLIAMESDGSLTGALGCQHPVSLGQVSSSPGTYNDGHWHHVALTYGGGDIKLYADGKEVGSKTPGSSCPNLGDVKELAIGGWYGQLSNGFVGALDQISIYNVELSPHEVGDHYARRLVLDRVGQRNGYLHGAASVAAVHGQGLLVSDSNDHVNIPLTKSSLGTKAYTLSIWVQVLSVGLEEPVRLLGTAEATGDGMGIDIDVVSHTLFAWFRDNDSHGVLAHPTPINDGSWHHVVLTFTPLEACLMVDGVTECGDPGGGPRKGDALVLGNRPNSTKQGWTGVVDDIKIFGRVLQTRELEAEAFRGGSVVAP